MTNDEFKKFIEKNKSEVNKIVKEYDKLSIETDKKIKDILSVL
jgi:hypothetical protein